MYMLNFLVVMEQDKPWSTRLLR